MSGTGRALGGSGTGVTAWVGPACFALGYWAAAAVSLELTRGSDGIAAMWPASGVLLGALLWLPVRSTARCIGLTAIASIVANLQAGNAPATALIFTAANMSEALVAIHLIGRTGARRLSFIDPRDVTRFGGASVAAAVVSAAIAWIGSALTGGTSDWLFALSWLATVVLGLLIVTPVMLITMSLADPDARDVVLPCSATEATAMLAMVTAVSIGTFTQNHPVMFLPLVALLAATYRLGPLGAAMGVLIIALVAPPLTALGYGPLALAERGATVAMFFLQFYLLVSFATALPLAALLAAQRRLARQCAASERMHRLLADSSSDVIVRLTPAGVPLYVSPAVAGVLGYAPDEVVGHLSRNTIHPADRPAIMEAWDRVLGGADERLILRLRRKRGGHAWLEIACRLVGGEEADGDDADPEVVASVRDVTERRAAELAAKEAGRRMGEANRLLGMAERVAQVGHWHISIERQAIFWSPEVFRIHGVPLGAMPTLREALGFYHPDDRATVTALVNNAMVTGEPFRFEARIIRGDGETRHVVSRGQPELGYDGEAASLFGVVQDVTRQVLAERELDAALQAAEEAAARAIRMADTDALTGVASRRKALVVLDEAIAHADATGEPLAVAIFDIDHFKQVNDRWGHGAGDAVLRRVSRAVREAVRPTDLIGRLGGEEFLVILPGVSAGNAVALAETVRRAIEASGGGVEAGPPVTASIGIALLVPGGSAAALLGEADRALYRAKASGRNAARLAA